MLSPAVAQYNFFFYIRVEDEEKVTLSSLLANLRPELADDLGKKVDGIDDTLEAPPTSKTVRVVVSSTFLGKRFSGSFFTVGRTVF